ncbi:hypothetical protein [Micromonospora sp. NPDC005806]|uniref:hypothetical protein n=1 Tax=Micromonospora sp. NPDC005806 TaxID=3364234 RepID=UPI0036A8D876
MRKVLQPGFDAEPEGCHVLLGISLPGQNRHVAAMQQFRLTLGLTVDEWVSEIRGWMDLHREKFLALIDAVDRGDFGTLVVAHQARLARFGFEFLKPVAGRGACEAIVANQEALPPQRELVEYLQAIVHAFVRRLDGLRRYEKELKPPDLTGAGQR